MELRRCEFFEDLIERATQVLAELGVNANEAELAAGALADHIAESWGGQNFSMPMDWRRKLTRIELELYEQFDGSNIDLLAQRYGIHERTARRYVHRIRKRIAEAAHAAQGDLFL